MKFNKNYFDKQIYIEEELHNIKLAIAKNIAIAIKNKKPEVLPIWRS